MRKPKTVKEYLSFIREVEKIRLTDLKGFDKIEHPNKGVMIELQAAISNCVNELL